MPTSLELAGCVRWGSLRSPSWYASNGQEDYRWAVYMPRSPFLYAFEPRELGWDEFHGWLNLIEEK